MLRRTTGNLDSQDSPRPELGGSHHLPPYNILCASARGPHPNGFFVPRLQSESPKIAKLGLSQLWNPITLCPDLRSRWGLKHNCSLSRNLSNGMWHNTYTQGNRVDSQLLVVRSQIVNLTSNLSFGHNLCFKCPNGWSKPILNIYVSISFQWYKELFKPLGFHSCNHSLNIWESIGTLTPNMGVHLGVWGFFLHTFLHS